MLEIGFAECRLPRNDCSREGRMQTSLILFAYFGPEVQLPLISFIGAVSGFIMVVGGKPIRMIKRWLKARSQKSPSPDDIRGREQ
jgi:hypothetical protein